MTGQSRTDLAQRVALLARGRGGDAAGMLAIEVHQLRCLADAQGRRPVAAVARALECALARGETGALITGWLELLCEALECGRDDAAAHDTFAAACLVRFAP